MFTQSSPQPAPILPKAPPKRKRGAQPSNKNARKHGFYARHSPHPFMLQMKQATEITALARENPATIPAQIEILRQFATLIDDQINLPYGSTEPLTPTDFLFLELLLKVMGQIEALAKLQYSLGAEMRQLKNLAKNVNFLTTWEFQRIGLGLFDTLHGRPCIWGRFASLGCKTPPYFSITLRNLKDP